MPVLLSTVAVVCTMSYCSDYVLDTAQDLSSQTINTTQQYNEYNAVWEDEKGLSDWLIKHQIGETVFEIVSIDIESQDIKEDEIP